MLRLVMWITVFMLPVSVAMAEVEPIPGDLDRDGDVDFADFLQFAANFGKTGPPPEAPETKVVRDTTVVIVRDTVMVAAKCEKKVSLSLLTPSRIGPVQAGKPFGDLIRVKVIDESGAPVGGVAWRWETDEYSGWVFPFEGVTEDEGLIDVRWVAGSPGEGVLSIAVDNAILENSVKIETVSTVSPRPPHSAVSVWFDHERRASAYSVDLTPLTAPHGTFYAILWDVGYAGFQRGSRLDRLLFFSIWDTPDGIDAEVIELGEGVICNRFGNEGTGLSCELEYLWSVGKTYRFEVVETVLRGGSVFTLHVIDLETEERRFVGKLRYGARADLRYANVFTEDFARSAPTCLAQPVRSAAFGRFMAKIDGVWQQLKDGRVYYGGEDSGNPGTRVCANRAVRFHEKGLELVIGGRNVADPDGQQEVTVP